MFLAKAELLGNAESADSPQRGLRDYSVCSEAHEYDCRAKIREQPGANGLCNVGHFGERGPRGAAAGAGGLSTLDHLCGIPHDEDWDDLDPSGLKK